MFIKILVSLIVTVFLTWNPCQAYRFSKPTKVDKFDSNALITINDNFEKLWNVVNGRVEIEQVQPQEGPYKTYAKYVNWEPWDSVNGPTGQDSPLLIENYNTGYGMQIRNYCDDDEGGTGAGLQILVMGENTSNALYVVLQGTTAIQYGINIDNNSDNGKGIQVYNIGSGYGINVSQWDETSLGVGFSILNCTNDPKKTADTPAAYKGINIYNVSASGGYGIKVANQGESTGGTGVEIYNGETGSGESVGLYVNNNSANYGIKVEHSAGDAGVYLSGTTTTAPLLIAQNGTAPCIAMGQSGAGYDITGTGSTWYINKTGDIVSNSIYLVGNCSALTFTDRTPNYEGNALSELKNIKSKDGKIDHSTMPEFMKYTKTDGTVERNLGNTITMLVKAVQELNEKVEALENARSTPR